ncbi:DUF397 domain-containing protein [Streptomyces johnsoniae]|uniref:DUF397 domain-containing protein n=1 Tax=Streptomyces johnsoniae TaxID=3075532 RepID=A0ABU2S1K7_9ACTN|nr:DUF397 domain-containing protein [Streptomyces sp. DSM 41886]MDT0442862.1 DUF397 domain-containing protein [Streptomyces sp. DSM 41886]
MNVEEMAWDEHASARCNGIDEGHRWRASSYSSGEGGQCVEVATYAHIVHVRDSKDIAQEGFAVRAAAWGAFLQIAAQ